ncbi:MAG: hypothetical protein OJF55_001260 [Rhodanobacteraceae bacterium]|jgi:uncharacterized protein (DUF58 family)|nr:MAG: hypothetical protein OJF55_001260 [Rhodanobacteraceae bacterium]
MDGLAQPGRTSFAARVRHWSRALMRGRKPEALPVRLDRRRIYIVPTRAGLGFAVLLATMLVGALNYQNNAALLLTCLLGAALASSMLLTWRELHDLTLRSLHAEHGFCGARLPLHLAFADDRRDRHGLSIATDELEQPCPLTAGASRASVTIAADRRGWMAVPRMRISSTLPFGLFRAWSWITPAQRVLVYPRFLNDAQPPARHDDPAERIAGGDEFAGLRDYHPGDPIRHVAWKASARHGHLLVREFDRAAPGQPLRFDWHALTGIDRETRISRLAGWVCEAYAAAHPWILVLEDQRTFGPASDAGHYHRCLTALAELP